MGGAGRQRTEPAFLRRKAFWPIKMKYAGHRLNLRDAPKVVKMLCSPAQSGTSGHPTCCRCCSYRPSEDLITPLSPSVLFLLVPRGADLGLQADAAVVSFSVVQVNEGRQQRACRVNSLWHAREALCYFDSAGAVTCPQVSAGPVLRGCIAPSVESLCTLIWKMKS